MSLQMEFLLVAGVVAFYLQDSMLLLHFDEVVLVRGSGGWSASVGADAQVGGRHPFLPNPLMPGRPVFRAGWLTGGADAAAGYWDELGGFVDVLDGFGPGCRLVWLLLLVALPALLFAYPHPMALLALLGLVYATIAGLGLRLWRHRRALGLDGRGVAAMAFEVSCCPPYAINLVRRLSLRRGLHADAITAGRRLLDAEQARVLRGRIASRIEMAQAFHDGAGPDDDGSGRAGKLERARRRLEESGCA